MGAGFVINSSKLCLFSVGLSTNLLGKEVLKECNLEIGSLEMGNIVITVQQKACGIMEFRSKEKHENNCT